MVYFVAKKIARNINSGLNKRCFMWQHYWLNQDNKFKIVEIEKDNKKPAIFIRILLNIIPYKLLPSHLKTFIYFNRYSLFSYYEIKKNIRKIIIENISTDNKIFFFRSYNLYAFSKKELKKLLSLNNNIIIDFDESDYLCLNSFNDDRRWNIVKQHIFEYEQLLLNQTNVQFYVSGENEKYKLKRLYGTINPILVMRNKLSIATDLTIKKLDFPIKFLIIGTYNYFPNQEMLINLLSNVIPYLSNPHRYEFHIVGSNIKIDILEKLKYFPFVKIHGYLEREVLVELYKTIHFNLTLLSSGGGTKYKIIESLAFGIPIIANELSIEGLDLIQNLNYILFDIISFDQEIDKLVSNDLQYLKMQEACYYKYFEQFHFNLAGLN